MAATKYLARDLTIEVESETPDSWYHIGGLNSLTHSPSTSRADTTDFDSNGHDEHLVASRGESWTLAGFTIEDVATGERDAGQERVEAIAKLIGLGGLGRFRITSPGGNLIGFDASAEVTLAGGGHNDAAAWQAVLTITGEPDYTAAGASS